MISNKLQQKQRNDITQRKLKLFDYITNIIACISKAGWLLILNSSQNEPTFDDRQAAPLDLLPEAAHQPLVEFLQQLCEVVWIRLHDLVELGKLAHTHSQMSSYNSVKFSINEDIMANRFVCNDLQH